MKKVLTPTHNTTKETTTMMTTEQIQERIEKAEQYIAKKYKTIENKHKLIAKKQAQADKMVVDSEQAQWEKDWLEDDIVTLNEDIVRIQGEIEDKKNILEKHKASLAKVQDVEDQYMQVPEIFKDFEARLIKEWDSWDKKTREQMSKLLDEIGYREFDKIYGYYQRQSFFRTDAEFHEDNVKSAKAIILDLYNRVYGITGEVTSWNDLCVTQGNGGFGVLNGTVRGVNGNARVESILAGGYNIQRLHIRTLVHAF